MNILCDSHFKDKYTAPSQYFFRRLANIGGFNHSLQDRTIYIRKRNFQAGCADVNTYYIPQLAIKTQKARLTPAS